MGPAIEVILSCAGNQWIALYENHEFCADSLAELEAGIKQYFRQSTHLNSTSKIQIQLRFDLDVIPAWIRQYHPHYFNRLLTVTADK